MFRYGHDKLEAQDVLIELNGLLMSDTEKLEVSLLTFILLFLIVSNVGIPSHLFGKPLFNKRKLPASTGCSFVSDDFR